MTVAFGLTAAPAFAAPPCQNINAVVGGLDDGNPVATGRSTIPITISGQDEGEITNVVASAPAPATAQATLTAPGKYALALNIPSPGSITLTLSWDERAPNPDLNSNEYVVPCTQTTRITVRAWRPAAIGVRGEGTGFENGIVGRFPFAGCRAPVVAAPITITARYRLGPRRRAYGRIPIPRAPDARSPKLVFVVARPCVGTVTRQRIKLPGKGSLSGGSSEGSSFEVVAARRARGRYAYAAHLRVDFAQPGFKTVRFDVTGYFQLGAGGKGSSTTVRRLH
jgi:hypothetical protein